ncbi:hypothetical protein TSUD_13000 [Trifolium subterraneum]|uniref:Response regulatory domain-containing protein n=1 Tax=Trifolium subterraneum TaxID=3900 RepID=A0A2Z6PGI1_TRISU|nr:hypothetical protein TSUD_13000 [Trifolium subterraneum]
MASQTRKLFVVSQDSKVIGSIRHWANKFHHEVTINSIIPQNALVGEFNDVDFIIVDGNLAHADHYSFLELVSKNAPVVVISDTVDDNSYKKNAEALKKGAIHYWYPPIDEETYKTIESLILGKKSFSTSKKMEAKVEEGETSSEVQGNEDKKRVQDSPSVGLHYSEGGRTIRYVETPGLPKKP